jgi:hypothetical protein
VLELTRVWADGGYASALLVEAGGPPPPSATPVPLTTPRGGSEVGLWARLPVQCDWFEQYQSKVAEKVRAQLWTHWQPKCVEVFRRLPPLYVNDDAEAYFRWDGYVHCDVLPTYV